LNVSRDLEVLQVLILNSYALHGGKGIIIHILEHKNFLQLLVTEVASGLQNHDRILFVSYGLLHNLLLVLVQVNQFECCFRVIV